MNNNIGVLIKELRLAKHISQSSLCENICSKEYISKIERKEFKVSKEKIKLEEKCKKLKYATIFFGMFAFLSTVGLLIR